MADLNRTLKESVHYPPHGPRRGPAYKIFNAARPSVTLLSPPPAIVPSPSFPFSLANAQQGYIYL